jgi:DNA-binding CsgD family transcriptional regulator
MNEGAINHLTETQKTCLRLVLLHLSSKDIGRQLGSSPHTIDNHIKAAMARLGAVSRVEAARMLADDEGDDPRRSFTSQVSVLAERTETPSSLISVKSEDEVGVASQSEMRSVYRFTGSGPMLPDRLPLPGFWGEQNDLSSVQKLGWIMALVVLICLSLGAVMASVSALNGLI